MTGVSVSEENQKVLNDGVSASGKVEMLNSGVSASGRTVKHAEQWCFSIVKKMMKGC
jgi:hypothetical protein